MPAAWYGQYTVTTVTASLQFSAACTGGVAVVRETGGSRFFNDRYD
jgi:hypothetical protein